MKKYYFLFIALVMANIAICASAQGFFDDGFDDVFFEEDIELYSMKCWSGGPNSSACSIDAGVDLGEGVSAGCSVTCNAGFYACCGLGCKCINITDIEIHP